MAAVIDPRCGVSRKRVSISGGASRMHDTVCPVLGSPFLG